MPERIELGTIGFEVEVKNGDAVLGSQQFQVLQNNMREVGPLVPDGKYKWALILDLEKAEKVNAEGGV